ncbi:Uncharacterized protein AB751O23_AK_00200 [Chlamydiales bacterium SCGC AB-751-O23]|jgi:hypothetical protein|nr:Uncharacterized protein AB751O23_AK_00200 [Chlamydiales bacterium SCGC AB-751-O23]
MWNKNLFIAFLALCGLAIGSVHAEASNSIEQDNSSLEQNQTTTNSTLSNTEVFTGMVNADRVRLRLQPALESKVVKEVKKGDLLLVTAESDDFYQVSPQNGFKVFIFRTFVLDDAVEGNHVNVRLHPSLDAPVVAQLNTGAKVTGIVNSDNSKWLEIDPPQGINFFVAKNFITQAGDENYMNTMAKREKEVNHLLNSAYLISQAELKKSFDEVDFEKMTENFKRVLTDYSDFPQKIGKAEHAITLIQESYLKKKIAFLESQAVASNWREKNSELSSKINSYQSQLDDLERQLDKARTELNNPDYFVSVNQSESQNTSSEGKSSMAEELIREFDIKNGDSDMSERMKQWTNVEKARFHLWAMANEDRTIDDFLNEEKVKSEELSGVVEPYYTPVKNKPGDHVLRDMVTGAPIAYLYSTKIDLQKKVGQRISIKASQRPNNFFAYPAYHVWSAE